MCADVRNPAFLQVAALSLVFICYHCALSMNGFDSIVATPERFSRDAKQVVHMNRTFHNPDVSSVQLQFILHNSDKMIIEILLNFGREYISPVSTDQTAQLQYNV